MKLTLHRDPPQPGYTSGTLSLGDLSLVSIERPWIPSAESKGGTKGVSCVPTGVYRLVRHNTEAHPMTWALVNEDLDVVHYPGDVRRTARTAVLIHPANFASELRGCVAPGMRSSLHPQFGYMVLESRKAMRLIQERLPWNDDHQIEIIQAVVGREHV